MNKPKVKVIRVTKVKEADYALLGDFGGRPWYISTSPLIYDVHLEIRRGDTVERVKRRCFVRAGLITDRATVFLYACRAVLNRIGLWEVIKDPAAFHDWLPSERLSDTVFRHALKEEARLCAWRPHRAAIQRWVMFLALALTFPLRGFFARRPRPSVWVAARKYADRHAQENIVPYTTHDADHAAHKRSLADPDFEQSCSPDATTTPDNA